MQFLKYVKGYVSPIILNPQSRRYKVGGLIEVKCLILFQISNFRLVYMDGSLVFYDLGLGRFWGYRIKKGAPKDSLV